MVVIYEAALGTTFPIAGLALILMRWVLFDEDLWNMIGGVTSASPMVKVVRGMMDAIGSEKGEMGKFLRQAPNWGKIKAAIVGILDQAPETVQSSDLADFPLYFHLKSEQHELIRNHATRSYGIADDIAQLIVES